MCHRRSDPERDGVPPLTWLADIAEGMEGSYTRYVCDACTRKYVRAIEAKLDQNWW